MPTISHCSSLAQRASHSGGPPCCQFLYTPFLLFQSTICRRSPKRTRCLRHISATRGRSVSKAGRSAAQGIRMMRSRGRCKASICAQSPSPATTNLNHALGSAANAAVTSCCGATALPACSNFGETFHWSTLFSRAAQGTMVPFVSTSTNTEGGSRESSSAIPSCCNRGSPPVTTKLGQAYSRTRRASSLGGRLRPFPHEYLVSHQEQCKLHPASRMKTAGVPARFPSPCRE